MFLCELYRLLLRFVDFATALPLAVPACSESVSIQLPFDELCTPASPWDEQLSEEMAQLVAALALQGGSRFDAQNPCKKPGVAVCALTLTSYSGERRMPRSLSSQSG